MVQLIYRTPPDVGFVLVSHPSRGRDRVHGQQERRPQAEGGGRSRGQADLPRDVEHQPGVRAAGRARGARGRRSPRSCTTRARWARGSSARVPGLAVVPKGDERRGVRRRAGRGCSRPARPGTLLGPSGATAIAAALEELVAARRARRRRRPPRRRRSRRVRADAAARCRRRRSWPTRTSCRPRRSAPSTRWSSPTTSRRWRRSRPTLDGNLTGCVYSDTHRQGRRRLRAPGARAARQGRAAAERQDADRRRGVAGDEPRRPVPGDRPPRLHGGRHSGVAAALRGAALLRRRPPAPPARRAREQEPHGQDVAADRRRLVAGGRRPSDGDGVVARFARRDPRHRRAARDHAHEGERARGAAADHGRDAAARSRAATCSA